MQTQLTVEELRDMVGREGEVFSNRVLHYASGLRGTRQFWFRQRSRLIAMVDTLGLPTVFFTHSAAGNYQPLLSVVEVWQPTVEKDLDTFQEQHTGSSLLPWLLPKQRV